MSREEDRLRTLAAELEMLNAKLEASNARMTSAILILTDIIDDILPHIVTDEHTLTQLREANLAARQATYPRE